MAFISLATVTLALALGARATLGPVSTLPIVNTKISPDGFERTFVY